MISDRRPQPFDRLEQELGVFVTLVLQSGANEKKKIPLQAELLVKISKRFCRRRIEDFSIDPAICHRHSGWVDSGVEGQEIAPNRLAHGNFFQRQYFQAVARKSPTSVNVTARPGERSRYLHLAMEDRAAEMPFREKA